VTAAGINTKLTPIYLNDHLAGATLGLELARRALSKNRDTPFEPVLETLANEIDEDRAALRDIMRRLEVGEDPLKKITAFAAEKVGRFKLNGSWLSYSPLSRLVEFEALLLGVSGKLALWRALQELDEPRLADVGFAELAQRAEAQRDAIEAQRLEAARIALGGAT
jgi:hypothetical protein